MSWLGMGLGFTDDGGIWYKPASLRSISQTV